MTPFSHFPGKLKIKTKQSGGDFPSFPGVLSSLVSNNSADKGNEKLGIVALLRPLKTNASNSQMYLAPAESF